MARTDLDTKFMRMALREARKGLGKTSPNPTVGAVVVRDGRVLSKGFHRKAGFPHAEVEALRKLGHEAKGCTLYVTLEPCNHYGRTPPCTHAIVQAGISRVVVGMMDPNPNVTGGGCQYLSQNGIQVECGVLEQECRRINEAYIKFVQTGRPFILVKCALTMDGWTATRTGHSKWITNARSRAFAHRLRRDADAVMVGLGTVLQDDPLLTARDKKHSHRQPLRIIVDTNLSSPVDSLVFRTTDIAGTAVAVGSHLESSAKIEALETKGVEIIKCPVKQGKIDLAALMDILGKKSIVSLLVEGGARIIRSLIQESLVDKFYLFLAPKLLGGGDGIPMIAGQGPESIEQCLKLKDLRIRRFEEDVMITAYPVYQ